MAVPIDCKNRCEFLYLVMLTFGEHQGDADAVLGRLKQATMAEQEDEEDKMRWRIEAEVRPALEAAQQAAAQQEARYQRELANLKVLETSTLASFPLCPKCTWWVKQ